jgi:hypothetical protein
MRAAQVNRPPPTEDARAKMRANHYQPALTPEQEQARRAKIAASLRGMPHPWAAKPDSTKEFTNRHRARRLLKPLTCALAQLGHCVERIDTAHLDGNYLNNAPDNLLGLCRRHHFLYDYGYIDLANPKMPDFYIGKGGKYRYRKPAA